MHIGDSALYGIKYDMMSGEDASSIPALAFAHTPFGDIVGTPGYVRLVTSLMPHNTEIALGQAPRLDALT